MKKLLVTVALIIIFSNFLFVSSASYDSYVYSNSDKAQKVPNPYKTSGYADGNFGNIGLSEPGDIFVFDECIYVLDSGNSRVVVLDNNLSFIKEIKLIKGNKEIVLKKAEGLFVSRQGELYICDKKAKTVYVTDKNGNIKLEIISPPKDKVDEDFKFTPISVTVDSAGIIYIISDGSYAGALQYDADGEFIGFYGSEQVTVTAKVLINELWKKILSKEAAKGLTRNVPTSIIALDIDADNFIYTLKGGSSQNVGGQVRKLNTLCNNILLNKDGTAGFFGDTDTYYDSSKNLNVSTVLIDIAVDDEGFITVLDHTYNRLFQYSQTAQMLYAFSGKGNKKDNFSTPVAIDFLGDNLIVLDSERASVTKLEPTDFALNIRKAVYLANDGLYKEAKPYFENVLKYDAYYEIANDGLGTVCEENGDYSTAMQYYKIASDKDGYSSAFSKQRDIFLKKNFMLVTVSVVAFLLLIVLVINYKEKHKKNVYSIKISKGKYPIYCVMHPFKAYYELKVDKKGSLLYSSVVVAILFIVTVINERLTSFHFSSGNKADFNILLTFGKTVGLFVLFVLCNWAVSTLADGEGTLKEIWIFTGYSLIPLCVTVAVMTLLSNFFTIEETAFYITFWAIGIIITFIDLFMAIKEVHGQTIKQTVILLIVTAVGIYLLILIITLGYSLFVRLIGFIATVYGEYRLR